MIAQDRLCLRCEQRAIIGKPWSVYVCRACYIAILTAAHSEGTFVAECAEFGCHEQETDEP